MTESILIWGAAIAVAGAVVLVYGWRFQRRVRADAARKDEATRLGIDRPAAQYPFIDPSHCIGCGACVAACPEGDVLGVVGGTAVVINGLRCVGHGRCETACPVGAIEVGLGDMKSRADVPQVDETYESSVPGVFVVGELGGLSLVRNAIAQGSSAAREIVRRVEDSPTTGVALDVAIVGAGPSGLAAGSVCARAGLRHVMLERESDLGGSLLHYPRRKMVLTQPVELPGWGALDREEYAKEQLLETLEAMVAGVDLELRFDAPVASLDEADENFVLHASGERIVARHVVLALGRRGTPRKLGIPGEELPKVMYRLIDAASYEGQRILVVGGGDSAVEAALGLGLQRGNEVTLSYRRDKIVRVKKKNQDQLDDALAKGRIRPLFSSQPVAITDRAVRLTVQSEEGEEEVELANDYVFVFAGGVPPFGLLRELGLRFGDDAVNKPGQGPQRQAKTVQSLELKRAS